MMSNKKNQYKQQCTYIHTYIVSIMLYVRDIQFNAIVQTAQRFQLTTVCYKYYLRNFNMLCYIVIFICFWTYNIYFFNIIIHILYLIHFFSTNTKKINNKEDIDLEIKYKSTYHSYSKCQRPHCIPKTKEYNRLK